MVGVNSAQGNIAGSPVLFKHLSRMPQYLVWLELLGDIVDATGLLEGTNAPGDKAAAKSERRTAQNDFAVGGLDFNKAIGAMMSPLTEFELPAEVVPTDLLVEIVIEMTIGNVRNRKVKILYEALRLTGGIELISREVAKRLAETPADPNEYWKQNILPKIKAPIETGRNDLVDDIYETLNALIPSARLKAPKPPEISVGTTPYSMEDPPEAEPFLRAGDPLHPDMAPRPEHSGLPLPERLQARLQSSFGHDLGHVRLHRDREADDFVRGTGAEALTSGSHIYLRDGLNPDQGEGAHILRHEVAHVLQQTGAQPLGQTRAGPVAGRPGRGVRIDPYREAAAERMAVQARGRSATDDGPMPVDGTGERVLAPFEKGEMVKLLHKLTRNAHPTAFAKSVSSGPMLSRGGQTAKTRATDLMADLRATLASSATKRSKSMRYGENAIADIKAHVGAQLGKIDNATVLKLASSAIVELPAARQTGRNKYELLSQNFLNVVEGYLFSQTGVRLTIDADNKNPNKVDSVAIRGLHLGAITANTALYKKIKDAYTVVDGLEFGRLRAYLRARFPLPHVWKRSNDLLLDPGNLKKIAAATKKPAKLDPKNLPPWRTYAHPKSSEKIALRVANHGNLTGDDAATERESHHLPQFLLVEFYTGQNANVNIFGKSGDYWTPGFLKGSNPQMTRPGRKSVYTGFKSPTHDLNFKDFKTESNRGAGMPAISLAAVTHQKGGLHLNQERSWDASKETKTPSTQGFTMFNRHREHLIAEVKSQPALKKNDPAAAKSPESASGFRAMVDEATGGTTSQKDALRNATGDAIKKSYALFIQRMKPALESALIDHELPYYAGLAAQHPDYADTDGNAYRPPDPSDTKWVKTVIGAIRTRNETAYAGWINPGAWS